MLSGEIGLNLPAAFVYDESHGMRMIVAPKLLEVAARSMHAPKDIATEHIHDAVKQLRRLAESQLQVSGGSAADLQIVRTAGEQVGPGVLSALFDALQLPMLLVIRTAGGYEDAFLIGVEPPDAWAPVKCIVLHNGHTAKGHYYALALPQAQPSLLELAAHAWAGSGFRQPRIEIEGQGRFWLAH